jgi:dihydroneopterin aldolase
MTALLASVTNLQEARMALKGGANIIDLKDPARGALGAVSNEIQQSVTRFVGRRRPVSATVGDLPMSAEVIAQAIQTTSANGVDFVKVGLFERHPHADILNTLAAASQTGIRVIAVLFADQYPPLHLLDPLRAAGCSDIILDTADKASGGLLSHIDTETLAAFVRRGKKLGLLTGLAGSLQATDIPVLSALAPDYLGFRTALCQGGIRTSRLSVSAIERVRAQLDEAGRTEHMITPYAGGASNRVWTQ